MISMLLGMFQSPIRSFAYAVSQVALEREANEGKEETTEEVAVEAETATEEVAEEAVVEETTEETKEA